MFFRFSHRINQRVNLDRFFLFAQARCIPKGFKSSDPLGPLLWSAEVKALRGRYLEGGHFVALWFAVLGSAEFVLLQMAGYAFVQRSGGLRYHCHHVVVAYSIIWAGLLRIMKMAT